MNDKLLAHIVSMIVFAACCIGVSALIVLLGGIGLFAWFADNGLALFALALVVAAGYVLHRDRKKRRQFRAGHERTVNPSSLDEAQPLTPRYHHRSPGK